MIYKTSHGTLILGDCLEVMNTISPGSINMVLCDLPYGTTQNKWDTIVPLKPLWTHYNAVCSGVVCLTASQPFTSLLVSSNTNYFKYSWIWNKKNATGHLNAKIMPMKLHEDILIFKTSSCPYYPQGLKPLNRITRRGHNGTNFGKSGNSNFQEWTGYPRSILNFAVHGKKLHPTQKPVELFEYLIKTYTNEGDTVLDNCAGSGTTAIACINTGRKYICIEKNSNYFEVAKKRIQSHL